MTRKERRELRLQIAKAQSLRNQLEDFATYYRYKVISWDTFHIVSNVRSMMDLLEVYIRREKEFLSYKPRRKK